MVIYDPKGKANFDQYADTVLNAVYDCRRMLSRQKLLHLEMKGK